MKDLTAERGLNRRAFIGASAGTAAAAAVATTLGPFKPGAGADADPSAHDMKIPTYRVGWQIFTGPSNSTWRSGTQADPGALAEASILPVAHEVGMHAFEGASGRFEGFVSNNAQGDEWADGHEAYSQWAVANRVRLVGDHAGPNPTSANNTERAIAKMAAWEKAGNTRALGRGGSTPGQNPGNDEAGQLNNVNSYLAMNETLNQWGWNYQNGWEGAGGGLPGARYYQHTHREWGTWNLLPDGHKYKDVRQMEMSYDAEDGLDEDYAFVEIDLAWIYSGVRIDVNRLHGDGVWTPEQISDETVRLMGLYGDRTPFFHVKDVNPASGGGSSNGSAQHTGDPLGDNVPFQRIFQQLRHPSEHEYLIERDGAGGDWENVVRYGANFLNGVDQDHDPGEFMPGVLLDRSLVGAPANADEPSVFQNPGKGHAKKGHKKLQVRGVDQGTWVRHPHKEVTFKWLSDGIPVYPLATHRNYNTAPSDAGKEVVVEVRAHNEHGSTTENSDPPVVA